MIEMRRAATGAGLILLCVGGLWSPVRAAGAAPDATPGAKESDARRTREFAVMGYEGIRSEIDSGNGPYLKTLLDLLHVSPDDAPAVIAQVRSLLKRRENIMDFADETVALQRPRAAALTIDDQVALPTGPTIYSGPRLEGALNHLTRGMRLTVFTRGGGRFSGEFDEYAAHRLWLLKSDRRSFPLDDILAIDAAGL